MQYIRKFKYLLVFFGLMVGFALTPLESAQIGQESVYFYNPETNIDNFALLKKEFDTYLSRHGDYGFIPFSKAKPFENAMVGVRNGLFFVSSWHFKTLMQTRGLNPVLVAVVKGSSTHKKVLTVKRGIDSFGGLRGRRIASSSSKVYTQEILKEMIGTGNPGVASSFQVLTVPKDIDALMSVAFGMAESALTTRSSLDQLALLNPTQRKRLNILASSDKLLLPIVSVAKGQSKRNKALIEILKRMGADPQGDEQLQMLGLDGFRSLAASDKKRLEQ